MQDYRDLVNLKNAYIKKCQELETELSKYGDLSEKMAVAEVEYRKAKTKKILELKANGMAVTLIQQVIKGKVSDQLLSFKIAEGVFHACRENIKRLHANLDAYRTLLSVAKKQMEIL